MADIPQAPVPGEDVRPAPLPTPYDQVQASPEVFGAGAGRAAERTAALTEAIGQRAKDVADFGVVSAADAAIVKTQTALLHDNTIDEATGQPRGYLYSRGHDAQQRLQPTIDAFSKAVQAQADAANNPQQEMAIRRRGQMALEEVNRQVTLHAGQQMDELNAAAVRERVSAAKDLVINSAFDPAARTSALLGAKGYVMGAARLAGDPEDKAGRWVAFQKQAIEGVVQHMLAANQGQLAEKFLDEPLLPTGRLSTMGAPGGGFSREQIAQVSALPPEEQVNALRKMAPTPRDILGSDGAGLVKQVEGVSLQNQALAQSRTIIGESLLPTGKPDLDKAFQAVDEIQDPRLHGMVRSFVYQQARELHQAWQQKADQLHTAAWDSATITDEGTGQGRIDISMARQDILEQYKATDPEGYRRLEKRSAEDARLIRRADTVEARRATFAEQKAHYSAIDLMFASDEGRREILAMSPGEIDRWRDDMNSGQFGVLKKRAEKLRGGQDVDLSDMAVMKLAADIIRPASGVPLWRQPPRVRDQLSQFALSIKGDPEFKAWTADHPGKVPPRSVLEGIAARKKIQVPQPGTGFGIGGIDFFQDKPYQFELDARDRVAGAAAPASQPARPSVPQKQTEPGVVTGKSGKKYRLNPTTNLYDEVP